VKFGFIAKHRGIWPADWICGALGVSRAGFYGWLTRSRSERSRGDEELGAKVRASFLASDRTYGARRVWRDLLAEGVSCGLHRIERFRHGIVASAIITAFGLGWLCASTWYSSRTAGAETLSRTTSFSLPGVVSERRAVLITGNVGSSVPIPAAE
jgi:hypothetical protein